MTERITVTKTYKLFINGAFPRSESGRSLPVRDANGAIIGHLAHASRKDMRDAVEAARAALSGWSARSAYNRGQILYRLAEMLESRRQEFAQAIKTTTGATIVAARKEVDASIDRVVCFAGWADKFAQVIGCANPVAGPYYNFSIPEPTGVVAIIAPDEPALLGLVSLLAPSLCAGNTVVLIASEKHPIAALLVGEVCPTADVPAGVVNVLTSTRAELVEHLADHRDINAIVAANVSRAHAEALKLGAAENIKRVHILKRKAEQWLEADLCESPWSIEPTIEVKTIWHPSAT